jgi:hypothetical protein
MTTIDRANRRIGRVGGTLRRLFLCMALGPLFAGLAAAHIQVTFYLQAANCDSLTGDPPWCYTAVQNVAVRGAVIIPLGESDGARVLHHHSRV